MSQKDVIQAGKVMLQQHGNVIERFYVWKQYCVLGCVGVLCVLCVCVPLPLCVHFGAAEGVSASDSEDNQDDEEYPATSNKRIRKSVCVGVYPQA
jgi:hypothetical protein